MRQLFRRVKASPEIYALHNPLETRRFLHLYRWYRAPTPGKPDVHFTERRARLSRGIISSFFVQFLLSTLQSGSISLGRSWTRSIRPSGFVRDLLLDSQLREKVVTSLLITKFITFLDSTILFRPFNVIYKLNDFTRCLSIID